MSGGKSSSGSGSKPKWKPPEPKPEWDSAIEETPKPDKPAWRKPMPYRVQMAEKKRQEQEDQERLDNWLSDLRNKGRPEPVWHSAMPEEEPKDVRKVRDKMSRMTTKGGKSKQDAENTDQWIGGLRDSVHNDHNKKDFVVDVPEEKTRSKLGKAMPRR